MWSCPICCRPLSKSDHSFRCSGGHAFDVSRSGYVHLLPSNRMHGKNPGDNKAMVDSRRRFLELGFYRPLADAVAQRCVRYAESGNLLDIGCGEGYYTGIVEQALHDNGGDVCCYGIDISKTAIDRAARRYRGVQFAVGSAFHLPIRDDSCRLVLNLFAPYCGEEVLRALQPDGVFIMAIPGREHLWELKQSLYENPYKNEVKPFELEGLDLIESEELKYSFRLTDNQSISDLFMMTPYYYKTGAADQKKLEKLNTLHITAHFHVLVYTPACSSPR